MICATRQDVVDEAVEWLHTPYHHAGRIKSVGVDCGMFLLEVFNRVGLIPRIVPEAYPRDFHLHRNREWYAGIVAEHMDPTDDPQPGDVVLFRFGRIISHGAIVIEWPRIIHSYVGQGVILDDAKANKALASRITGTWTMRGIQP